MLSTWFSLILNSTLYWQRLVTLCFACITACCEQACMVSVADKALAALLLSQLLLAVLSLTAAGNGPEQRPAQTHPR